MKIIIKIVKLEVHNNVYLISKRAFDVVDVHSMPRMYHISKSLESHIIIIRVVPDTGN